MTIDPKEFDKAMATAQARITHLTGELESSRILSAQNFQKAKNAETCNHNVEKTIKRYFNVFHDIIEGGELLNGSPAWAAIVKVLNNPHDHKDGPPASPEMPMPRRCPCTGCNGMLVRVDPYPLPYRCTRCEYRQGGPA